LSNDRRRPHADGHRRHDVEVRDDAAGTSGDRGAAMTERNKTIVRRLVEEVIGRGRVDALSEILAPHYVAHLAFGDHFGPEGLRIEIDTLWTAFPDLTVTLDDLLADGDRIARRYTVRGTQVGPLYGHLPSGRPAILRGLAIDRLTAGRIVESWIAVDVPMP
jgi:predicted ester cyclase